MDQERVIDVGKKILSQTNVKPKVSPNVTLFPFFVTNNKITYDSLSLTLITGMVAPQKSKVPRSPNFYPQNHHWLVYNISMYSKQLNKVVQSTIFWRNVTHMALFGVEVCRPTGRGDSPDAKLSRLAAVV